MVALRLVALLLLVGSAALPAHADVFPYEAVGSGGPNNSVDVNASSCDSVLGCFTRTGTRCALDPNQLCDLQIVPAGRCSSGNLAPGLSSCIWPHRAGRCNGSADNNKVGCLPDSMVDDTASAQCSGLSPGTCDLSFDKYGRASDPNDVATCTCSNGTATSVCGGDATRPSVCSDGDPTRTVGGLGVGLGVEINLGTPTFSGMGPAITGQSTPKSTPGYAIENPPVNFDPQRDAGSVARTPLEGTGLIHEARATDARLIEAYVHPTLTSPPDGTPSVRKVTSYGDSYWGDWVFISVGVTGTFNTHIVTFPCDPDQGWVIGTPINGQQCYEQARNGISFLWENDLTPNNKTYFSSGGVPVCPPHCYKDFNLSTMESEEFAEAGLQDPNAGIQLALQSGEPVAARVAGARDTIGVAAVTSLTFLVDTDIRCKMGGWGNAPGLVGRCVDGPRACAPGTVGDATCFAAPRQDCPGCVGTEPAQGGSCRACFGPFDAGTNPLGLPIGYNTHGFSVLDLVSEERIGGIQGQDADIKVPLFVVGTTGNAAADFRDIAGEDVADLDLSDLGPVDPGGAPFLPGVGAGGTFPGSSMLNIDEPCCGTSGAANVAWDPENGGTVDPLTPNSFSYRYGPGGGDIFVSNWGLVYDKGAGPDGIPGCIGDNVNTLNGSSACNNRLGFGVAGAKTNAYYATGLDDRAIRRTVGAALIPASGSKFLYRNATPAVMSTYFPGATQNPPTTNVVAAFTIRDLQIFQPQNTDVLVKVNTTQCPLTVDGPQCSGPEDPCALLGGDADADGVCQNTDNCDLVANPTQTNSDGDTLGDACDNCSLVTNEAQTDGDADARGDACDNCPTVANGLAQAAVTNVGNQIDGTVAWTVGQVLESTLPAGPAGGGAPGTGDGVGDACDSCPRARNPRVAPALFATEALFFASNQWATLTGGQRDDDHDGFGNKCDGDFTPTGALVGSADLTQYRASSGKSRTSLTACGSPAGQRCARYDMDESGALLNSADLTVYRGLSGKAAGPKCPTCPLVCTSGTAVTCASPP